MPRGNANIANVEEFYGNAYHTSFFTSKEFPQLLLMIAIPINKVSATMHVLFFRHSLCFEYDFDRDVEQKVCMGAVV